MSLYLTDVNPESRKEGSSEDRIKLTAVNKSRHITLKNSELGTGSKLENLDQKIGLGDVAKDQRLKSQRELNWRLVPVGMRGLSR